MKYTTGHKHQLVEDISCSTDIHPFMPIDHTYIHITIGGTLTVKKGYAWDGASGCCPDNKYTLTPSLFHDALYQLMRLMKLSESCRKPADLLFYKQLRERKLNWLIAKFCYRAIRRFGASSTDPRNKREVLEVR